MENPPPLRCLHSLTDKLLKTRSAFRPLPRPKESRLRNKSWIVILVTLILRGCATTPTFSPIGRSADTAAPGQLLIGEGRPNHHTVHLTSPPRLNRPVRRADFHSLLDTPCAASEATRLVAVRGMPRYSRTAARGAARDERW
ncbi:uncharacterized protein BXZ73DRAFT_77354 [Epithele typhae]|uniref:uncharacterized protein n=1 Tax=Epithele typhae TaxID=378194 RepID=UPI0020083977|nr:uncharacterized protein BXZ73DRAFT_77354 [Epithele typhae]KAH9933194.1 hypothetical protein BXZ73DRAFT_77354 [Epithele typhae]